jgi:hypothetical protein
MTKSENVTSSEKANRSARITFGRIFAIVFLLVLICGCVGTLGICYTVATRGVDIRVNGGDSQPETATESQNIVEMFCFPFSDAISQIFDSIFQFTR